MQRRPRVNINADAVWKSIALGNAVAQLAGAMTFSAMPPQPVIATTLSPTKNFSTPVPTASTTPDTSAPGRERPRRAHLVGVCDKQHVGIVHTTAVHLDSYLVRTGERLVDVVAPDALRTTRRNAEHSLHADEPRSVVIDQP